MANMLIESSDKTQSIATSSTHCGYVAIVGRPNVGKSTLLNRLVGEKISIVSYKPQTTRHKILGIKTRSNIQIIYVDTPGLHREKKGQNYAINRYMNKTVRAVLQEVDVVIFVVEGTIWREEDELVLQRFSKLPCPIILAVNKVDQVIPKENLLPHLQQLSAKMGFAKIVPISAKNNINITELEQSILPYLPATPFMYLPEQVTDRDDEFRITEIIREKVTRFLGDELPYAATVEIERMELDNNLLRINAVIFVERDGQKAIIIGKHGSKLKQIGTQARREIERILIAREGEVTKVFLALWVKVKENWTNNERALQSLGYK